MNSSESRTAVNQQGQMPDGEASSYSCLLAGATGLVGSALLQQLVRDPLVREVTVLSRRAIDVTGLGQKSELSKLRIIVASLDDLESSLENVSADVVFCTLGTTIKVAKTREAFRKVDYEYPLALARFAKRKGSSQYAVVTAMGSSTKSKFFYNRVKGELEEELMKLELPVLHIFRPSLLLGERSTVRIGETIGAWLSKGLQFIMVGPLRRYRPIKGEDVAMAMKRAASQAAANRNIQAEKQSAVIQFYSSDEIADLAVHTTR